MEGGESYLSLRRIAAGCLSTWRCKRCADLTRAKTIERLQAKMVRVEVGAGGRRNGKRWIKENQGFDATADQEQRIWAEATQPGGPSITISVAAHISHMVDTAEHLATRPWSLVRFERRSLITCDSPVSLIRNPKDDDFYSDVGFATAWGISVPLTRELGLLMSDPMVIIERLDLADPMIQEIRTRTNEWQL